MEYVTGIIKFPRAARMIAPQTQQICFNFKRTIKKAVAGFNKISFGFYPSTGDQHLGRVIYNLETTVDDDIVIVKCSYGLRDWSGIWDDPYDGEFEVAVIVEFEDEGKSNLSIIGVEQSQAIQYFNSTLGINAQPNNFLQTIRKKDLVLRVYSNTDTNTNLKPISQITGILEFRYITTNQWMKAISINKSIPAIKKENINRTRANDSLNFLIPGGFLTSNIEYRVRVYDIANPNDKEYSSDECFGNIELIPTKDLYIYAVGINYKGNNQNLPAPSLSDLQVGLSMLRQIYPLSVVTITGYTAIEFDGNLATAATGAWPQILNKLAQMKGGSSDIYLGMLPTGVIFGPYEGMATDGCAVCKAIANETLAHEIGHTLGLKHVSGCGSPADPNVKYPDYGFANKASIGEVGIDPTGVVYSPQNVTDNMSYCSGTKWISPYYYQELLGKFSRYKLSNATISSKEVEGVLQPYSINNYDDKFVMVIRIYSHTKRVNIISSFIYPAEELQDDYGEITPYTIMLLDNEEVILYSKRLFNMDEYRNLDSPYLDFPLVLPYFITASKLVVLCGEYGSCNENVILCKNINKYAPQIRILYPTGGENLSGNVTIRWAINRDRKLPYEAKINYLLQYSNDNGVSFYNISPAITETEYTINFDNLKGGKNCSIKVITSLGLGSNFAISKPFTVPIKHRKAHISYPHTNSSYTDDTIIKFIGESYSPDFVNFQNDELMWYSSISGFIGSGNQIFTMLSVGEHTITLKSPDGLGGYTSDEIKVKITTTGPV